MILVDTSYLVYYHGFATWTWYSNEIGKDHIPDDGSYDPMTDPEYKAMFKKGFLNRALKVLFPINPFVMKSDIIFCLDCNRNKIWRKDLFPEYKILRKQKQKETREFSWNGIFNYVNNILLPEYQDKYGCKIVSNSHAEGDDCIAVLTKYLYNNGDRDIIIIGSDGDLIQLTDKALLITLKGEKKTVESVMKKYKIWDARKWDTHSFVVHKTLMGDKGDEIPGIVPKCGPKTALKYINNSEQLKKLLENKIIKDQWIRNTKIIDFDYIPKEITQDVISQFESQRDEDLFNL